MSKTARIGATRRDRDIGNVPLLERRGPYGVLRAKNRISPSLILSSSYSWVKSYQGKKRTSGPDYGHFINDSNLPHHQNWCA